MRDIQEFHLLFYRKDHRNRLIVSNLVLEQPMLDERDQGLREQMSGVERARELKKALLVEQQRDEIKFKKLDAVASSLESLSEHGGVELLTDILGNVDVERSVADIRATIQKHYDTISRVEDELVAYDEQLEQLAYELRIVKEDRDALHREEQEKLFEYVITREISSVKFSSMMPWSKDDEDEKVFRKSLLISLLVSLMLAGVVSVWVLPEKDLNEPVEIPERLAKLVIEKKTAPKPEPVAKPQQPKKPDEKKPQPEQAKKEEVVKNDPPPTKAERQEARSKAQRTGVLAFKDNFQDLIEDDLDQRLGAQTQLSTASKKENRSQRSLITAAAESGSSGIRTASISRNVSGSGSEIGSVGFARVESSIGGEGDFAGEERPLSAGNGPSRTDEEIQIVFDRYKSTLYRIYNRELRSNPALQGRMVLKITIEPNGSVSAVSVESSDMDSPKLDGLITARVARFNFGEKEGVPTITVLFPIDFLPAG